MKIDPDFDLKAHMKALELEREKTRPFLPMLAFDIHDLVDDARARCSLDHFPSFMVDFCVIDTLACIRTEDDPPHIFIHTLINDNETPRQVITHILMHEMIHILCPPELVDGKMKSHHEAFWRREDALVPERESSLPWIITNFQGCLHRNKKAERMEVKRNWRHFVMRPRCPISRCREIAGLPPMM